jgi:hypothetical protein
MKTVMGQWTLCPIAETIQRIFDGLAAIKMGQGMVVCMAFTGLLVQGKEGVYESRLCM